MTRTPLKLASLLAALALLVVGCADDGDPEPEDDPTVDVGEGDDSDVEITVEDEDGEEITVRSEEDEDGISSEVESDDGTVGLTAGDLPDEWPEEFPVPDAVEVGQVFTVDEGEGLEIQAMFGYTDDFDATVAYVESLADEGWDLDITDASDEFMDRADVAINGFGWDGEIEVVEGPNTIMNITLAGG